jgi:hypothetical protein
MRSHPVAIARDRQRRVTFRIQTARQAMVKPFSVKTHPGNHVLHPGCPPRCH